MDARVQAAWDRIEAALGEEDRTEVMGWRGATEAELTLAEGRLDHTLPPDLRASLQRHNCPRGVRESYEAPSHALAVFGLQLALNEGVDSAIAYAGGPMATRFSDSRVAYSRDLPRVAFGTRPAMRLCIPCPIPSMAPGCSTRTVQQDRTYFFLMVDLRRGGVCYVDFGDLVADVKGCMVAWCWAEYVEHVAAALEGDSPPSEWFPPAQFGFQGTDRLLGSVFPSRMLRIPDPPNFRDIPSLRCAVEEAYARPEENMRPRWVPPPTIDTATLPPPPAPLSVAVFHRSPDPLIELKNSGREFISRTYGATATLDIESPGSPFQFPHMSASTYIEILLGPGTIYCVGFQWKNSVNPKEMLRFGLANYGALSSQWNTNRCSQGGQFVFNGEMYGSAEGRFKEGDRVGLLVDGDRISFYKNRAAVHTLRVATARNNLGASSDRDFVAVGEGMHFVPVVFGHQFKCKVMQREGGD